MPAYGSPEDPAAESRLRDTPGEKPHLKLARYEVVRELGKGAMGIVYLAKDPLIGRLVALKTIRPAAHADDDETKEFQQRFVREAQAAGILNHPTIVTVHDIGQDDASGVSFIAMEYVEGYNLKEVLAQGRPLSFDQIGDLVAQVADALDFAHTKGIVHRDVKPANIIIIEGNRAKITDFGIAKIASGGANLTTTGQFLGTPNYMAPEQIKGAPVDGRTDLFSLGICLYECLTRRKPFGGDSLTSISYKIVHEPFPALQEINPQIPPGFEEIVAKCLAKDPSKRFQRGRDMAAAIRAVMRGERPNFADPPQADETVITRDRIPTLDMPFPDTPGDVTPEPLRTQAARSGAAPTVVSVPLPSVGSPGPAAAKPPAAKTPAAPRKPRPPIGPLWKLPVNPVIFAVVILLAAGAVGAAVLKIQRQKVTVPTVDTRAELRRAQERKVRTEANEMLRQGRINDAYVKYEQLGKLAPHSPAVAAMLSRLGSIRQDQQLGEQRLAEAKGRFDEGVALFNQKKFAEAVPLFETSFHLNPNSEEAATYLKNAQQEEQRVVEEKAKARAARNTQNPQHGGPVTATNGHGRDVRAAGAETQQQVQPANTSPA
ncbi:MAG: serine/threonine protein kinase, partial [Acidobacteria bacterium]|nr:serine/threonine protein kinase [Acidobacteriota bacterium]